ncbi:methionine ABC transporter permease [Carboxydothermus islandicus]|uniref:Methionine ABC transporter permease n=1 Tax=Carboxydothermus islandicus TaxID=661089 RepID=A0A1L8D4B5_9THEO|nr:methionine ABC transporter permease [Carboxydothermus islandicus]GAV26008.1 methionine ABC transporter permease [Carboxydothermus islandicus]
MEYWPEIIKATYETLYMTGVSLFFAAVIGIPVGVLLNAVSNGGIMPNPVIYSILGSVVNVLRSAPFVILMLAVTPLTRLIAGTSIGSSAAIVPLTIGAAPFVARLIEANLREVDPGVVEAARAMGANNRQVIFKVLLQEARAGIILSLTNTAIAIIGYSAMAGAIGGGGLGDLGVRYGYMRFQTDVMLITVAILVALVEIVQATGNFLARKYKTK